MLSGWCKRSVFVSQLSEDQLEGYPSLNTELSRLAANLHGRRNQPPSVEQMLAYKEKKDRFDKKMSSGEMIYTQKEKLFGGRGALAGWLFDQACAAKAGDSGDFRAPCIPEELCLIGPSWKAPEVSPPPAGFHEQFVRQIFIWFRDLQWFSGCSAGDSCDISWVEFFFLGR